MKLADDTGRVPGSHHAEKPALSHNSGIVKFTQNPRKANYHLQNGVGGEEKEEVYPQKQFAVNRIRHLSGQAPECAILIWQSK